jgi:hypothetical protein
LDFGFKDMASISEYVGIAIGIGISIANRYRLLNRTLGDIKPTPECDCDSDSDALALWFFH